MATGKPKLLYWDSSVFIHRIQRTAEYIQELEQITEAAEADEVQIITSAFTLAEVIRGPDSEKLPDTQERLIVDLFENDYIVPRPVDRFVGTKAREIARYHNLKPVDAVHVATAILAGVSVMHTTDGDLLKKTGKIGTPPLRIEKPRWTGQGLLVMPPASRTPSDTAS